MDGTSDRLLILLAAQRDTAKFVDFQFGCHGLRIVFPELLGGLRVLLRLIA